MVLVLAVSQDREVDLQRGLDRIIFDDFVTAAGQKAAVAHEHARLRRSAKSGLREVYALGVYVGVGCALVVKEGNATLELRRTTRGGHGRSNDDSVEYLNLRTLERDTLEERGLSVFMCRLRQRFVPDVSSISSSNFLERSRRKWTVRRRMAPTLQKIKAEVAFITSVSDGSYLWKYWRWTLNKLCASRLANAPYYVFVGAPLRGRKRLNSSCPATAEETLGHTSKALSLYLGAVLRLAERLVFLDADVWVQKLVESSNVWAHWLAATQNAEIALPAPCYKQFFGASIVSVKVSDWSLGFLQAWYDLRCGPKDQPSLWHLVFRSAGRQETSRTVLNLYQDPRCLNESTGELTKDDCRGGCGTDKTCGYYAAWKTANAAFMDLYEGIQETPDKFTVTKPLFTPGHNVAYLPNHASSDLNLLCGPQAPLRHIKFLRKQDRHLPPALCGQIPTDLPFKGPRDADFRR